jgi:eukaryotic-like serine/threonine-protein kinase
VAGDGSFDERADIYALGCVAFWLLTGRPPFEAGDAMSLLMHHSKTTPHPPSIMSEEFIPADVDALVLECLSKAPSLRPANAEVLLERFSKLSVADRWEQRHARAWWELHDPELMAS